MKIIKPGSTIGVIGGGQLGRMIALAAAPLGYKTHIFTDIKNGSASHVAAKTIVANYDDKKALERFAKNVDVVTFEFENIPYESIKTLEKTVVVRPGWELLHICQNRLREKDFINELGIKTAPYKEITSAKTLAQAYKTIGPKCILKTVEFGYDGKGQHIIDENSRLEKLWNEAKMGTGILEKMVDFDKEISVIIARNEGGEVIPYIPVENIHKNGVLDITLAPAEIDLSIVEKAWEIAYKISEKIQLVGLLAIEMFLLKNGDILVNEMAPRPHNSGHWTIDACITSQFEQLVRAVCGLPLGSTDYYSYAIMKNLIGKDIESWKEFIHDSDSKIHIYGKKEAREGRKMGHITHLVVPPDEIIEP